MTVIQGFDQREIVCKGKGRKNGLLIRERFTVYMEGLRKSMAVWKSSKNVLITCVLGVFVLVLGAIGIGERFFPTIVPDEGGY